jgi:pimeloyl-ACP methyl ester carboxylesterase
MRLPRRTLMTAATMLGVIPPTLAADPPRKRPVVMVHGASHGGWCWRDVRRILQARGHEVFTPTLTGLGERVHLRSKDITLATHVTDVANVITWEELNDVILVGHSFGGMTITGVCDQMKDRISHVIYLDAAAPEDGESAFPGMTGITGGALKDGYLMPVMAVRGLGIDETKDPATAAWVKRRLTEQLHQVWVEPIHLKNGGSAGLKRTYVQLTDPQWLPPVSREHMIARKTDPSWHFVERLGPHDVMITDPAWTADLIAKAA